MVPGVDNPFVYAKPVPPEDLIDREHEIDQLRSLLRGGHNCQLSAPRRYGKTSLVQKVRAEAELTGSATVYVNFYGILSVEEAVARLERGYRELRGPLSRWVTGKLASMNVSVTTPLGTLSAGGNPSRPDAQRQLLELLDLPRQLFGRNGERVLVCFDEFQEVLSTRTPLDGAIRSVIEQHHDGAGYLFAGSHPGMMRALFEDRERPFYGQARAVPLHPLASEDLGEYVGARFEQSGRDVGEALRPLLELAQGHPQRAMLLAHFLWERTDQGGRADGNTFAEALDLVFDELAEAFDRTWRGLDDGERRTFVAVVMSNGYPTRAYALQAADVPRSTVVEALVRLQDAGHLVETEKRWQLVDPMLARWVAEGRLEN
ncbi:MAG: uncharacterized protein V7607_2610 [Solirubrobacteraceae bacterium]